ncbi:alpha/beta hydrolase [soil metagenome]
MNDDGFHQLGFTEWGDPLNKEIVICTHGLTLNARYFDWFAKACEDQYRVICPDVVGRGNSDWINPDHYWYPQYLRDAAALLARLDTAKVNWVGTSMGGVIGMNLAAMKGNPIKKLVLNDVGPFISKESLQTIAQYLGNDDRFQNHDEVEAFLRNLYPKFGKLTDEQWRHLARIGSMATAEGDLRLAYDPAIKQNFKKAVADADDWAIWEKIDIPILILRGSESAILTQNTLEEMVRRNKNAQAHVFEGIGHAPPLMAGDQIDVVLDFLKR